MVPAVAVAVYPFLNVTSSHTVFLTFGLFFRYLPPSLPQLTPPATQNYDQVHEANVPSFPQTLGYRDLDRRQASLLPGEARQAL